MIIRQFKFDNLKEVPKVAGIYEIRNVLNNHRYVGSSSNIRTRFLDHKRSLLLNKHANKHLLAAFNKYGKDKFILLILEVCEPIRDTLLAIEQKYLDLNPEYNINKFASGADIGVNKAKHGVSYDYPIDGVDPYTYDIVVLFPNMVAANKFYGKSIHNPAIYFSIKSNGKNTTYGLLWKFRDTSIESIKGRLMKRKKRVAKYDLEGNLICIYNSVKEAADSIGKRKNFIRDINRNNGIHRGFKWKYLD